MPPDRRAISSKEYEETLKRIKDVMTARVVLDDAGEIQEVHVLAGAGRPVKYIARDIESSLIAAFGAPVDRRKISIAQLGGTEVGRSENRVKLEKIEIVSSQDAGQINVFLKMAGTTVTGTAKGVPTPKGWLYLAAEATISAIAQFLPTDIAFHVEDVSISFSRPNNIALVSVMMFASGQQQLLTGSCAVSHDDREAAVKATLDALNRKFAQLSATD
mgnify:CR=1 FL=1